MVVDHANYILIEWYAIVENLKAACKAPWDVKDLSAKVPESFFDGRCFVDHFGVTRPFKHYMRQQFGMFMQSNGRKI